MSRPSATILTGRRPASLYACVLAREFPAQAMLRLRAGLRERPCAVVEGVAAMQRVCSANAKARVLGVARGMTRVELDTFPSVAVLSRRRTEEAAAKAAVLECAGMFSPWIEDQSEDCAVFYVIDLSGTEKLHGAAAVLGPALLERVHTLGISCSIAIASNFHAAICVARGMTTGRRMMIVPPGMESTALAELPLEVLGSCTGHAETFAAWGIRTLGMLAELPESALIARMGQEGRRLRQLARGVLPHLFVPMEPAFSLQEQMELDTPVELMESLLFVVSAMLEQLVVRATGRVLALASVTITLLLEGGGNHERTVRPALPSNDRKLWIKLLHLDLEAHPPGAAIVALKLYAEPGSVGKVQLGLFAPQLPEAGRLDVTLAHIRALVGEERVGSPVLGDSHRPDEFQVRPFTISAGGATKDPSERTLAVMRWLRPAEEISATVADQRPAVFFFRRRRYEVERVYGPWLASGEWWSEDRWGLQQWDLVARPDAKAGEAGLLCCCVHRDVRQDRWRIAALYD